jgi:hypothetical protein
MRCGGPERRRFNGRSRDKFFIRDRAQIDAARRFKSRRVFLFDEQTKGPDQTQKEDHGHEQKLDYSR